MTELITITGPDDAQAAAVADALADQMALHGEVARRRHTRALPRRRGQRRRAPDVDDAADGFARPVRSCAAAVRLAGLWLDHAVGWAVRRPLHHRVDAVIQERGWWHLAAEPGRTRARPLPGLAALLGRALPGTRTTIVLAEDPESVHERRPDLPVERAGREADTWRRLAADVPNVVAVEGGGPVEEVAKQALAALEEQHALATVRWRRLGIAGRSLTVPTCDRRATESAFALYQPLRPKSRLAWHVGRAAAWTGALRVLEPSPPPAAVEALSPFVPPGGHAALLQGANQDRGAAMLFDASGRAVAVAKVALTAVERDRLAEEAARATAYGPLVTAPLAAPDVLAATEDVVLFSVAEWVPRRRPWVLEPEVAEAMGRFHVAEPGGLGHGDFAPWNLLRTRDGWSLVDWERAGSGRPAYDDVFHHLVQGLTFLGHPTVDHLVAGVRGVGPVHGVLAAYARGADLSGEDLEEALVGYLDRTMVIIGGDAETGPRERATRLAVRDALEGRARPLVPVRR